MKHLLVAVGVLIFLFCLTSCRNIAEPSAVLVAEAHDYNGLVAQYDITDTPEAAIVLAALEAPSPCPHEYGPPMGGMLCILVTKNAVTATYIVSTCSDSQPVLYENPDVIYHLTQEISPALDAALSLPEAQVATINPQ